MIPVPFRFRIRLLIGRSMKEIAAAVGFSTYSGFWKAFCSYENLTPSEYRKNLKRAAKSG